MQAEDSHLGFSLGAVGAVAAIAALAWAAIGQPHWLLAGLVVAWLSLWLLAAVMLSDSETRGFLVGTLRHSKYTQIYTRLTRGGVLWVWSRLCDPADDKASWPALFRAALTTRLYDKALLLAVAYPILLLVGQWVVTGAEGRIGNLAVLPEAAFWPARASFAASLLILATGKIGEILASASQRPGWSKASGWLFLVAVAFAFAGAYSAAVAVAVAFLDRRGRQALARALLTGAVLVALMIMVLMLNWSAVPDDRRSLFLFLAALPLLNGLFDLVSYALTLSLIRRGLRSSLPLLWGLADLALACLLFLALRAVLVVAVHGLNLLAGMPFVDLSALFAGIHVDPGAYV